MSILAWLVIVGVSPAPEPADALEWEAPPECPQAREVTAMAAKLGQRPDEPTAARGVVRRASSGAWVLRLELRSTSGRRERTLQAAECPLLARAAALVIAVHRDARAREAAALREPEELAPSIEPPVPPSLPQIEAPSVPPIEAPAGQVRTPTRIERLPLLVRPGASEGPRRVESPEPDESRLDESPEPAESRSDESPDTTAAPTLAGHLRGAGGLDLGLLPNLGGSLELAGGLAIRGVRLELGVLGVPNRSGRSMNGELGGRFDRLAATLRVCPGWRVGGGRGAILGCLGGEGGAIRAVGDLGVTDPRPIWAPWGALLLGPALRWRVVGPMGLWFAVEGVIALTRPTFTVGAGTELFQVTPAGLRINLGIDLQFVARKR